jgi:hypothetical protein
MNKVEVLTIIDSSAGLNDVGCKRGSNLSIVSIDLIRRFVFDLRC